MGARTAKPIDLKDTVLLFKTVGSPRLASRLHHPECNMVKTVKRGIVVRIDAPDQYEIDDLNERGFTVGVCKCLKEKKR
jgi:hypothetical protein